MSRIGGASPRSGESPSVPDAAAAPAPATPRIVLTMIVRNEARVVERCLDAARTAIDALVLCDTGSTDGTPELAEEWRRRHDVPGRVHRHRWRDFGHNRSLALRAARDDLREWGWDAGSTFLLFLDADMVLEIGELRPDDLTADVYRVVQRNGALVYSNVRLARASLDARFVGATHEYYASPPGAHVDTLTTLTIDDRNDGGSRADKFERDIRLLREELGRDPTNCRAMFYLGQSYRAVEDFPRALFWYRRRIAAGGWLEEVWYSWFALGLMYTRTGETASAVRAFHRALRLDPGRAEPCFHLASYLRGKGRYGLATAYARRGLALPPPSDQRLFVERDACDYGLLRELAIAGYYTAHREEAAAANETLAVRKGIPPHVSALAVDNSPFFAGPLPGAAYHALTPAVQDPFVACNPSILRTDEGYLFNVRAVSYRIDPLQRYVAAEPDGILRTRNYLMRVDSNLRFLDQREMTSQLEPLREHPVQGLEDCRLFALGGAIGCLCVTTQYHPAGPVRISLLMLDGDGSARHLPVRGYGDDLTQKNWLPFVDPANGELRAVYGCEPLVVLRIDPESGNAAVALKRPQGRNFGRWRGSAGPIDLPPERGGGRLLLVHEVAYLGRRYYLHRWVRVDDDWRIVGASRPFYFLRRGIEFACGACLAHGDEELFVTLGVEDCEAYLCRVPLAAVEALIQPFADAGSS